MEIKGRNGAPTTVGEDVSGRAKIGYRRVSTRDHNPGSQRDALIEAGCDKIFIAKASGKPASRPELDKALDYARTATPSSSPGSPVPPAR